MCYNLGASPCYDTPKKQMLYLANNTQSTTSSEVFGDLYQWGRHTDGHEKRSSASYPCNNTTIPSTAANGSTVTPLGVANLDVNGQPAGTVNTTAATNCPNAALPVSDKFIKISPSPYDWRTPQSNSLWGNGNAISVNQTPHKTVNDPCPLGWRVPTQDEWEKLCNYDGNPNVAGGDFYPTTAITSTSTGLTWVAVRCGSGVGNTCIASNSGWSTASPNNANGYAIYSTSVWSSSGLSTNSDLLAPGSPEPLLFLPAAGYRGYYSGAFGSVGTYGGYWSSSINGTLAYYLLFYATAVGPDGSTYRADGFSVRCVSEL